MQYIMFIYIISVGIPDRYLKYVHQAIKSVRNSRANSRAASSIGDGRRNSTTTNNDYNNSNDRVNNNSNNNNTSISLKPTYFTAIKDAINKSIHSITPKQNSTSTTPTTATNTNTIIVTPYTPSKNKGGAKVYICPEVFSTVEDDLSTAGASTHGK